MSSARADGESFAAPARASREPKAEPHTTTADRDVDVLTPLDGLPDHALSLLNDLGEAVIVHDREGQVRAVTDAACHSLGYTRDELMCCSLVEIEVTRTAAPVAEACDQMRRTGATQHYTGIHRHKDGSLRTVEIRARVLNRTEGDLFLTVARDVSAPPLADSDPRENEAHLRSLIERSPFGIAVTRMRGEAVMVNRRLAELLGRAPDDLQGLNIHDLYVDPADRERLLEIFALRNRVQDHEVRLWARDPDTGDRRPMWFQIAWQPTRFEGQDAIVSWYQNVDHRYRADEAMRGLHDELQYRIEERTRELGVEITERKYAEEALKEANDFLEQKVAERTLYLQREIEQRQRAEKEREKTEMELLDIIETAPIAVGIADQGGRFLFWNPLFFKLGRQFSEPSGKISFGLNFTTPDLMTALQGRVMAGERVEHEDVSLRTGDDELRWVLVSVRRLTFEGQAAFLTWVFDITDMKEQAEALEDARQAAEDSARAKSAFLATMSHEIRTPMNGVITMAEMLGQSRLDRDQRHMLGVVIESAGALLSIIDEILDFSKIEAGRVTLESASLSLGQLVERVADLLAPRAEQKGLDLLCWSDPDLPDHVAGDLNRLRQILVNLAGNAIKFTERGHVVVSVSPAQAADAERLGQSETGWVRFAVTDTGIGLTEEQIAHLFQPFTQADSSTQRRFGGTGLGLSISRTLVTLMGGRIGVDSAAGEGAQFWFEVPLRGMPERRDREPSDILGARVLVISDAESSRARLEAVLSWGGAEPVLAGDLDAAKGALMHALVEARPFDAVILDRRVNKGPGSRYVDDVLRLGGSPSPPVLVVVARGSQATSLVAERDGVAGVIGWPLHRLEVAFTLSIALGRTPPDAVCPWRRRQSDRPVGGGVGHYTPPPRDVAETAGCLILVAEDNATNQTVIRMLMARLGLVADVAADGREALSLFETRRYGLVVTDCHMPDMDGYELTERIRAQEAGGTDAAHTPIVALTADAIAGTAKYCLDRGMDDYLTKPVAVADLEAVVVRWLPRALELRRPRPTGPAPLGGDNQVDWTRPDGTLGDGAMWDRRDGGPRVGAVFEDPSDSEPSDDSMPSEPVSAENRAFEVPGADQPVLDTTYLRDLVGGDEATLKTLLLEFLTSTEADVAEAVAAFADGRLDAARKAAHTVSGAARSAGALRLGAMCRAIDTALLEGDTETPRAIVPGLPSAFDEAAAAIQAL
ncbi:PAS domain S-box protein [Roseospira marina]|uniref:Sensory/regulatory protein RpfC n=1 Tax=Roseospira marina TaxID=140057 RepID=A0A5M6IHE2_9PROT|nr:PAS domain S-box protein [Roseospira marina]KAA5606978.1 PAS domain S-box protein [Roseospira marina]MBB4312842.1 PAS domain S-box-containing protein [Roseospira marina]MBB5086385.1 PAS domain S-box-containing protein [Roseospira marina]